MKIRAISLSLLISSAVVLSPLASAQAVDVTQETAGEEAAPKSKPAVGKEAARKYFKARQVEKAEDSDDSSMKMTAPGNRYLAVQLGTFISEKTYKWGNGPFKDVGQLDFDVTYKVGEWTGSMDLLFKADVITYSLREGNASKLSLMPAIAFPDAASEFPLYFGAGAGLGIFFTQIEDESSLSFDWSVFAGARVFDVFNTIGLIAEVGVKNHILLLSDGQYNGVYVTLGTVFHF